VLGAVGAWATSRGIVTEVLGLPWRTDAAALGTGVVAAAALTTIAGIAANTRAIQVRPAAVLRGE
jgi:predicted lysophospholipase L1 biosynthesis ABC-type transport system permease subunit